MATSGNSVTVLNQWQVRPPPENLVSKMPLRLTFFDMLWLHAPSVQRLMFYKLPHIKETNLLDKFIPKLRHSLSITLRNYLPLAGNLIIPPNLDSGYPEILYTDRDSVTLIVAESHGNFDYLTGNHARNCSEFHQLVPELTQFVNDSGSTVCSVFAVQVTLFPNMGISVGITNHPAAGDGGTFFRFMRIWALNAKIGEKEAEGNIFAKQMLPLYFRNIVADPMGVGKIFWAQWNDILKLDLHSGISTNTNKVRQTFLVSSENVHTLKNLVRDQVEGEVHLTTFKVVCAYLWTCLVKSRGGEIIYGEELEHFVCFLQCRNRIHYVLGPNYFGNCLTICLAKGNYGELVGERAITNAVELIRLAMDEKLDNKYERLQAFPIGIFSSLSVTDEKLSNNYAVVNGAKEWLMDLKKLDLERAVVVACTPTFNYYTMNFGWGKPIKFEFVSIDKTGAISLCWSGNKRGMKHLEVGLSLPKPRMDAFVAVFLDGLKSL